MKSGIYRIKNLISEKIYVGSAVNISSRFFIHQSNLRNNKHPNKYLQASWNKYGEAAFEFIILEHCSKDKLIEREQYWIDYLNCINPNGYNANPTAGSRLGTKHSEETLKKLKAKIISNDTRNKMSKAAKGRIISIDQKLKMSLASKGKPKLYCRKLDKWPHELGYNCKCLECSDKKKEYFKLYSRKRRAA